MHRGPFLIASLVSAGPVLLAMHLAVDPGPFGAVAAALLAAGAVIHGLISTTGLLLSRGRWSRRFAVVFVAAQLVLAAVLDPGPWLIGSVVFDLAALGGLAGPWLTEWVRQRPAAEGPGPRALLLLLGTVALVPAAAIAAPSQAGWQHLLVAGVGGLLALAYSRAGVAALWLLRVGLAFVALPAILSSPQGGAVYLAAHVGALVALAWSRESALAAAPLLDTVYGPRAARRRTARERERS